MQSFRALEQFSNIRRALIDDVEVEESACAGKVSPVVVTDFVRAQQEAALDAAVALDDAPEPYAIERTVNEAAEAGSEAGDIASAIAIKRPGLAKPLLHYSSGISKSSAIVT